jgi:hypothetical protein
MHDAIESFTSGRKRVCNCASSDTVILLSFCSLNSDADRCAVAVGVCLCGILGITVL